MTQQTQSATLLPAHLRLIDAMTAHLVSEYLAERHDDAANADVPQHPVEEAA